MNYYLAVLKKYAVFSGRAQRAEYWYFVLFNLIIQIALTVVVGVLGEAVATIGSIALLIYGLAILLPAIGVTIRRLHDTNRSGWWLLIAFIPLIGIIVLIVFLATDSIVGENQYGKNPKEVPQA